MTATEWFVGSKVWNGSSVYTAGGAKVTTGNITILYVLDDIGTTKYLQDDLTTISATLNTIDIPYVAGIGAHAHLLTIPESFRGLRGEMVVVDTTSGFEHRESFVVPQTGSPSGGNVVIIPD